MISENNSAFGHVCNGGGAEIKDSPINITLNINIIQADEKKVESLIGKMLGMIGINHGYSAQRLATIENAQQLSSNELQRSVDRALQNG